LIQVIEQVGVENLLSVGAVEPLDVGVLVWLGRLDVPDLDKASRIQEFSLLVA
jgi:hypothetical protein